MTPKEKAQDLLIRMWSKSSDRLEAKECALIAVDEILASKPNEVYKIYSTWIPASTYWIEVKIQIEKL